MGWVQASTAAFCQEEGEVRLHWHSVSPETGTWFILISIWRVRWVACCSINLSHSDSCFRLAKGYLRLSVARRCGCCRLLRVTEQTCCQCVQGKYQRANSYGSAEAAARHGQCAAQAAHSGDAHCVAGERPVVPSYQLLFYFLWYWTWKKNHVALTYLSFRHLFIKM